MREREREPFHSVGTLTDQATKMTADATAPENATVIAIIRDPAHEKEVETGVTHSAASTT